MRRAATPLEEFNVNQTLRLLEIDRISAYRLHALGSARRRRRWRRTHERRAGRPRPWAPPATAASRGVGRRRGRRMEGTRNKPRCRPGLWPPPDRCEKAVEGSRKSCGAAADAAIVLVRCRPRGMTTRILAVFQLTWRVSANRSTLRTARSLTVSSSEVRSCRMMIMMTSAEMIGCILHHLDAMQ